MFLRKIVFDIIDNFWHCWNLLTIFVNFWRSWLLTISDSFKQFLTIWHFLYPFANIGQFELHLTMLKISDNVGENQYKEINKDKETCHICDIDYSDHWEPDFKTIFVTWHLRVTLDSICNSCDVYFAPSLEEPSFRTSINILLIFAKSFHIFMTDYDPGWHTRGHGGTRGSRGAPGGTRGVHATPGAKKSDKTAK